MVISKLIFRNEEAMMNFSKQLREQRKQLGLTQAAVAERLHVTRQTISNWEQGKNYPDLTMLVQLSTVYQISLDSLLKGDQRLKDSLERGRANHAFNVISGLVWIMYGLIQAVYNVTNIGDGVSGYLNMAITMAFFAAFTYSEYVAPFFLGISGKTYNRLGHRPDQRPSLLWKVWLATTLVLVVGGLIFSRVLVVRQYYWPLLLGAVGVNQILQKYMWKVAG